jgi:riboflavin biosynthesis pyrimidine reductase
VILSSGRYLRDWAAGRAQEILQIDDPRFADLREWRLSRGLPAQPDIALISGTLDFPIPQVLTAGDRKALVFTTADPDPRRVKEIEGQAGQVIVAGERSVEGEPLIQSLFGLGYRTIYSAAGPRILHLLISGGVLDRLYLTHANRILGGQPFASVMEGPLLDMPAGLKIHHVYLDHHALDGSGQLFVAYDRV